MIRGAMTKKHELADKISDLVLRVLDEGPIERSRSFLPVSSDVAIKPGEVAIVTARPQLPFRGDRLAVWSAVAASFLIESIRVSTRALDASYGTTPADAFATRLDLLPMLDQQLDEHGFVQVRVSRRAEECFGQPLAFPLAMPGTDVLVTVTNASEHPLRFVGVILGDVEHVSLPGFSRS
jgi:hypothetical protein